MNGGTEYAYDPDLPFVVAYSTGDKPLCRFRTGTDAEHYVYHYLSVGVVVDTTPKPKIPEGAKYITWGRKNAAYSRIDGRWYGWTDAGLSEEDLLEEIGDDEVIVLVPKEES